MHTRRAVMRKMLSLAMAAGPCRRLLAMDGPAGQSVERPVPLRLEPAGSLPLPLAADFTGLGYEMSSVATAGLLSAENARYVRLVRQLGSAGVIRAGGIVADYTRYDAEGAGAAEPQRTVITGASLQQFAGFLNAVGWTAIWSLNFAQGTLEEAVAEARAVAEALGPRLQAFELGNEVENYGNGEHPFRTPPYRFESYLEEFREWRAAMVQAVPGARFAAPDTAASVDWVERMAAAARGDVALLTTHYYRGGQRQGTAEQLAEPDPGLVATLARLRAASVRSGLPWRMCETNSFFGGGRAGVSDTLLGGLWTLDFMLLLAAHGAAGVNMETGVNQLGFVSSYSPITDDGRGRSAAGAPYFGMLAFAEARRGCAAVQVLALPGAVPGMTAYALGRSHTIMAVVVVNRSGTDVVISARTLGLKHPRALRLIGSGLLSGTGIHFAGSGVGEAGRWAAASTERVDGGLVLVAAGSAVVLRR